MCKLQSRVMTLYVLILCVSMCQTDSFTTISTSEKEVINLETAIKAERSERRNTRNVTEEFQVQLVKKMTEYRLQMIIHGNHSFAENSNEKWLECVTAKKEKIDKLEEMYLEGESACVLTANAEVADKKLSNKQLIKEIRKWRKGFKYLSSLCKVNYPSEAEKELSCLEEYLNQDSYDETLSRLLQLLKSSEYNLKAQALQSIQDFQVCLQNIFSRYLKGVRVLMDSLTKCYKRKLSFSANIERVF